LQTQRSIITHWQFQRWDYPLLTAGDGGLFSTLDDLFLWDQALNTECLVPKAALERASSNDGTPPGYGFGWFTNVFSWSAPRRARGQPRRLLQLHHPFSRYPVHDHRLDQSCGVPGPCIRAHQIAQILFGD
jgi:hypothetical protein